MAKSMTGYGRSKQTVHERDITVEVRSDNHRYFDCTIKYPRTYGFLEEAVKGRLSQHISRGKVDVFITIDASRAGEERIGWNRPLAESYLAALRQMSAELGLVDDVTTMSLARLGEIVTVEKQEPDAKELSADVLGVLEGALSVFEQMRRAEGEKLRQDVERRAATILDLVEQVERRSPQSVAEYRQKLLSKMREVLESAEVDEQRILLEAALFADRSAVDEETVRLRSHLDQLRAMLQEQVPVGRKLDFLIQEMNREANTIGSKGNDLEMAHLVVDLKAEIEKIREQVQNIE